MENEKRDYEESIKFTFYISAPFLKVLRKEFK
jgi:hypothetical protein